MRVPLVIVVLVLAVAVIMTLVMSYLGFKLDGYSQ